MLHYAHSHESILLKHYKDNYSLFTRMYRYERLIYHPNILITSLHSTLGK